MHNLFFELLKVSLGTQGKLSSVPSNSEWMTVLKEAQKQCVVSLLLDGLERLPVDQRPQRQLLITWIGYSQLNEATYALQCKRSVELTQLFHEHNYNSCVLKGVGFSQFYPIPSHRQGGDIDIWVEGERKEFTTWLKSLCVVEHIVWHHIEVNLFDSIPIEIHFHPSWFYNPFMNRRLQHWFEKTKAEQMTVEESVGFAYPNVVFNAVYALVHIYHHLIEEGIGIRHIVDYFFILKVLPKEHYIEVKNTLESLGMSKLTSAIMWVLRDVCGMQYNYCLFEPNEKEGRFVLDEIKRGGNFGHYRIDNRKRNTLGRIIALLPHYPKEVLWVVPWKLWHKCWRLINA